MILRDLRNGVAKEMKYPDYFSLQVAAYGMTTDEMLKMLDDWMATLRPLYLQLHTWAKYKLAEEFHQPAPKKIPAHWISNRWAQEWPGLLTQRTSTGTSKAENQNGSSKYGRTILHRARVLAVASKFLGKIRSISGSPGFEAEEKHARLLLAYRS